MNKLEMYLVELLQHRLFYDNKEIQVVKDFSHNPVLPVITLDLSVNPKTERIFSDSTGGETLEYYRRARINVNLWCNTENERQSLEDQIMTLFIKEQSFHYLFCSNYSDGQCKTLQTTCKAKTDNNNRSLKHKCPNPKRYNYQSLMRKHDIECDSLSLDAPFELNELDRNPPLLRSVFICEALYVDYYSIGGVMPEELRFLTES